MSKKFGFSLQKLLSYKEQVFDIERSVLGDMQAVLQRLRSELADLQREHVLRAGEYSRMISEGTTPPEMERHKNYMMQVDLAIRQTEKQIELQQLAVEKQMDKVRECKIEISTMEKLREKKLEEYNYLESKAQELFIEEFVGNARASAEIA